MVEDKTPSKSIKKIARENIINEAINKYEDLDQLKDLGRAIAIGFPKDRDDLVDDIVGIWEDTPEPEILDELEEWYDMVDTFLYKQCDGFSPSDRLEVLMSLDGARFQPPYERIKENILKWRLGNGRKV